MPVLKLMDDLSDRYIAACSFLERCEVASLIDRDHARARDSSGHLPWVQAPASSSTLRLKLLTTTSKNVVVVIEIAYWLE